MCLPTQEDLPNDVVATVGIAETTESSAVTIVHTVKITVAWHALELRQVNKLK